MIFQSGRDSVSIDVPADALVYESCFPAPGRGPEEAVLHSVAHPIGAPTLADALEQRRPGPVCVVVSDITRPVPYRHFLPGLLALVEEAGVPRSDIFLLVATGMHRPSTSEEREEMFGEAAGRYRVVDHVAENDEDLVELPQRSWSGARVRLNRRYMEAGFRLITGLVEPHFMAGFSGGRKAVCPGLASLETVQHFHGAEILSDANAANGILDGNPCHEESLSVARMAPPDFCVNVVINRRRDVVAAFSGGLEAAHLAAVEVVRKFACPPVRQEADVVVTSCGGYPLDATFYQCVKGMVGCLPAVRPGGAVVAFGGCSEGIGSEAYVDLMRGYAGRWRDFLEDIREPGSFVKDQWELQMQTRVLEKVGQENLHFVTDGLTDEQLGWCSVSGHHVSAGGVAQTVQELLDRLAIPGATVAALPEGPYCTPVPRDA